MARGSGDSSQPECAHKLEARLVARGEERRRRMKKIDDGGGVAERCCSCCCCIFFSSFVLVCRFRVWEKKEEEDKDVKKIKEERRR